eukprot:TRINITY_DN1756_c0_g1_i3.p1 TRINITY_DN1756_c0_g1~~TRINITY_DN1756_c0_g1_i3.p1  ORF type:complete len:784 (+),score=234.68 TRINITY_DN1756_c0_g1_i3:77-2428(+)
MGKGDKTQEGGKKKGFFDFLSFGKKKKSGSGIKSPPSPRDNNNGGATPTTQPPAPADPPAGTSTTTHTLPPRTEPPSTPPVDTKQVPEPAAPVTVLPKDEVKPVVAPPAEEKQPNKDVPPTSTTVDSHTTTTSTTPDPTPSTPTPSHTPVEPAPTPATSEATSTTQTHTATTDVASTATTSTTTTTSATTTTSSPAADEYADPQLGAPSSPRAPSHATPPSTPSNASIDSAPSTPATPSMQGSSSVPAFNVDFKPLPFTSKEKERFVDANNADKHKKSSGPPEVLPEEIEYDPKTDFLGQGSFGSVYKGRCRGQEVAVKVPRKQRLNLQELTSFRHEVKMMSKIYHPNVVLFLGACTQLGKMQIVTERCVTDLERLLAQDKSKQSFSLYRRMHMARDAALGMNWLHGITQIVHNDLKSANLLVDQNLRVKVTDFGFSQIKEHDKFQDKSKKGTPLWMAPEVMMGQPYDEKADVYSFGIILWEILTRDVPYAHHNDFETFYKAVCVNGERPVIPPGTLGSLKHLITSCWSHEPASRPSFTEIVFRIDEVLVDCVIDSEAANTLWKTNFVLPKQELQEEIPWREFESVVRTAMGEGASRLTFEDIKALSVQASTSGDPLHQHNREVVTMERFDKTIKWFGEYFDSTMGPQILDTISQLTDKQWFHGDISKEDAITRLSKQDDGTFLIRLSSTDPKSCPFTLSMTGNQHRRIRVVYEGEDDDKGSSSNLSHLPRKGYKIQGRSHIYPTLFDLAENCVDYPLKFACPKSGSDGYNPYDPYCEVPASP